MSNTVARQKKIVEILTLLHQGGSFETAKELFDQSFSGIDVSEITSAERELIASGLDPQEIQRLCTIHAAVFKGSIKEIHQSNDEQDTPGHPVHTLKLENKVIISLLDDEIQMCFDKLAAGGSRYQDRLVEALQDLYQIDKHYARKETLIFSYMERYGITAPPQVMWGVDDEIRQQIKAVLALARSPQVNLNQLREQIKELLEEIKEMIFKEEDIMIPMVLEVFSLKDWQQIAEDSFDIGFAFIAEPLAYQGSAEAFAAEELRQLERREVDEVAKPVTASITAPPAKKFLNDEWEAPNKMRAELVLPTGVLNLSELTALFQVLPVDLTFVDQEDRVRFFSEGPNRVFPRTKSVIGREVINCHPPKSMHMVEQILQEFKSGERQQAEFWIDMGPRKIYIRYFALRNAEADYLGCLEVTQDVTAMQGLSGQKRLLD